MHIAIYWLGKDIYIYILPGSSMLYKNPNSNIANLQNKTEIIYKNISKKVTKTTTYIRRKKWQFEKNWQSDNTQQQHILTLSANNLNSKNTKLILILTQIIMYEIRTYRNNLKYKKAQLPQENIIMKILTELPNILIAHYKLHKLKWYGNPISTIILHKQCHCKNIQR